MSRDGSYPPGVTGNEYEIAGAQHEYEDTRECVCGYSGIVTIQEYDHNRWWNCPAEGCDRQHDEPFPEPDPDRYRDNECG